MREVGDVSRRLSCPVLWSRQGTGPRGQRGRLSYGSGSAACLGRSSPACRPAHSTVSFGPHSWLSRLPESRYGRLPHWVVTNLDALAELGQPVANGGVDARAEQ